eukprot:352695-Chlamydomonas_euryale.AAC.1
MDQTGSARSYPTLNDCRVRKRKEGTRARKSFLNQTIPVRDAGSLRLSQRLAAQVYPAGWGKL